MKNFTIGACLLFSFTAFSQSRVENFNHKYLLCSTIDRMLEVENADAAVDMEACLENSEVLLEEQTKNNRVVIGQVPFNSPDRSFVQTCMISYRGFFEKGILVGTVNSSKCF